MGKIIQVNNDNFKQEFFQADMPATLLIGLETGGYDSGNR